MNRTFGNFVHNLPTSQEYLLLQFSPSSISLKKRWRNNGLSADFMGDYFSTFILPEGNNFPETKGQMELKGAVTYIANELLDNAMKFNDDSTQRPISIKLQFSENKVIFYTTNCIKPEQIESFTSLIEKLISGDPQELYLAQLEENAANEDSNQSGLGFLTMINDYTARIGWQFETIQNKPEVVTVTTMVSLRL